MEWRSHDVSLNKVRPDFKVSGSWGCRAINGEEWFQLKWEGLGTLSQQYYKSYLAAVRHLHIAEGLADPEISKMVRIEQVLRGIKATQARSQHKGH